MNKNGSNYAKNKTADVVKKGHAPILSHEHWEINRNLTPQGSDDPAGVFLPRAGKNRPTPHTKTNECDH